MLVDLASAIGVDYAGKWKDKPFRFVVQWIASEREGKSVIPIAFWFFSIGGGVLLLGYALYRKDLVFILGQAFGVFVYVRNLYLVLKERDAEAGKVKAPAKARKSRAQGQ